MQTVIYNQKGEKVEDLALPEEIFGLPWNPDLMHQVVVSMQANERDTIAHAKGRGEVSGGGKKPWRQKGTGRARHGSIRSPIWVGGGVAHGPTKEKDYSKKINKKMKRKAFLTALSQKFRDNEILFLDKVVLAEPKTKEAMAILKSVSSIKGFEKMASRRKNKAILALAKKDAEAEKSFRNIPGMEISEARSLNPLSILTHKFIIISNPKEAIAAWK
ncbi:MAG: 50S ribosomal protein L4 [bacterium]|nr:50S ribosomal protein L4 [bacterium]